MSTQSPVNLSNEAFVRQQRILLKLSTYWAAHSDLPLADLVSLDGTDAELEESLDGALKAEGLSVSGGWRS